MNKLVISGRELKRFQTFALSALYMVGKLIDYGAIIKVQGGRGQLWILCKMNHVEYDRNNETESYTFRWKK